MNYSRLLLTGNGAKTGLDSGLWNAIIPLRAQPWATSLPNSSIVAIMRDSLFLMARPGFLEGMSQVLDLGDTMTAYNHSPDGEQADHAALWADWELVANDLRQAASISRLFRCTR